MSYIPPKQSRGSLFVDSTPGPTITITDGGTYYPWVGGTASGLSNCVASSNDGSLMIASGYGGRFLVGISMSFEGTNNENGHAAVHKNDVKQLNISCERKLAANDLGNMSSSGLLSLTDGDVLTLQVTSVSNGTEIVVNHGSLWLERLGD